MSDWHRLGGTFLVLASFFAGVPTMAQTTLPAVIVESEAEGWYDLVFSILAQAPAMDGNKRWGTMLKIGGTFDGEPIELGLAIADEWEEAELTPPPPFKSWASPLLFGRLGDTSDRFVRVLAKVYRLPEPSLSAREGADLDAISLGEDPRPIGSKPVHLKVFVHGDREDDYGEFYLNVDWKAQVVKLKEKDPEYRAAILRALAVTGAR